MCNMDTGPGRRIVTLMSAWDDLFVEAAVSIGVNADVVDSNLRMLKTRFTWPERRDHDPRNMAKSIFGERHE